MTEDSGVSAEPTGLSQAEPEVSALRASIPDALWPLLDAIYKAGVRRGNDEATAFEWGSRASGKFYDEMDSELHDWNNAGLDFEDPAYVRWDAVAEVRAQAMNTGTAEDDR